MCAAVLDEPMLGNKLWCGSAYHSKMTNEPPVRLCQGVKRILGSKRPLKKWVNTRTQLRFFGVTGAANFSVSAELAIHPADITNTFRTHCSHDYTFKCIGALVWALGCTTHSAPSYVLLQPRVHTCARALKRLVTAKCVLNIKSHSLTHSHQSHTHSPERKKF